MKNSNCENLKDFLKKEKLCEIRKIELIKKDNFYIKFFKIIPVRFYRKYYIKVNYKNQSSKSILITKKSMSLFKKEVYIFNLYLSTLSYYYRG
jgi:hypothetical protein